MVLSAYNFRIILLVLPVLSVKFFSVVGPVPRSQLLNSFRVSLFPVSIQLAVLTRVVFVRFICCCITLLSVVFSIPSVCFFSVVRHCFLPKGHAGRGSGLSHALAPDSRSGDSFTEFA